MGEVKNLIGSRFGRLVVIDFAEPANGEFNRIRWKCKCDCGNICIARRSNLLNGHKQSCGCLQAETARANGQKTTIHNCEPKRLYRIWSGIKTRCNEEKLSKRTKDYASRGIKICDEWKFSYIAFRDWAFENGYQPDLTIDRIDNNGNYEPNNCRWVSKKAQQNNTRRTKKITFQGETRSLMEWAELLNINYGTLRYRISVYPLEVAFDKSKIKSHK